MEPAPFISFWGKDMYKIKVDASLMKARVTTIAYEGGRFDYKMDAQGFRGPTYEQQKASALPSLDGWPAARTNASTFQDITGRLWMFGGNHFGTALNDLWTFDTNSETWAYVGGCVVPDPGQSIHCGTTQWPQQRAGAMAWQQGNSGNVILYGGETGGASFHDLWSFNVWNSSWTLVSAWQSAPITRGLTATTLPVKNGAVGMSTFPLARSQGTAFYDLDRNYLMLFGGVGAKFIHNDLWAFPRRNCSSATTCVFGECSLSSSTCTCGPFATGLECAPTCSACGNGTCSYPGMCECNSGFEGLNCNIRISDGYIYLGGSRGVDTSVNPFIPGYLTESRAAYDSNSGKVYIAGYNWDFGQFFSIYEVDFSRSPDERFKSLMLLDLNFIFTRRRRSLEEGLLERKKSLTSSLSRRESHRLPRLSPLSGIHRGKASAQHSQNYEKILQVPNLGNLNGFIPTWGGCIAHHNGKIYQYGGESVATFLFTGSVWSVEFNVAEVGFEYTLESPEPISGEPNYTPGEQHPGRRAFMSCIQDGTDLYIFGGYYHNETYGFWGRY